ncbi:MAG: SDR family NAD(P)-dependent oxidoreductase, partial [Planctomycetota bacterium]
MSGKVAVVTGGGTGIGRGIALELSRAGAKVTVLGRRESPLQETVDQIAAAGGEACLQVLDVCDAESVAAVFKKIGEDRGRIDLLVNNAGIGGPNACGIDGPDRWDPILRTNLDGIYYCSREALRCMPEAGRIINISSVLGQFGVPGYTAYCTSKHGVIGFTKALALEVAARKITVNAICPGWVETQMARDGMESMAEGMGIS